MRNIRLTLQYDGTDYHGWQSQVGGGTVQNALQEALKRLTGLETPVTAAGRTDAGVHALAQVVSFKTPSDLDAPTIKRALNALLPFDIRVVEASHAPDSFNPRFAARGKVYAYLIANTDLASPFSRKYVWRVVQALDLGAMRAAAAELVGRHDFRAFMGAGSSVGDTVREVRRLEVQELHGIGFMGLTLPGDYVRLEVQGDGFLRHMVRNIVGTLVDVGRGKMQPGRMGEILASGDRTCAGPTAPARGLFLCKVLY